MENKIPSFPFAFLARTLFYFSGFETKLHRVRFPKIDATGKHKNEPDGIARKNGSSGVQPSNTGWHRHNPGMQWYGRWNEKYRHDQNKKAPLPYEHCIVGQINYHNGIAALSVRLPPVGAITGRFCFASRKLPCFVRPARNHNG